MEMILDNVDKHMIDKGKEAAKGVLVQNFWTACQCGPEGSVALHISRTACRGPQ
jgi:hypothetical protein